MSNCRAASKAGCCNCAGKGKAKKKKAGVKKKMKRMRLPTANKFEVLLEESGVYEGKLPEPHYLSSEATPAEAGAPRSFCAVCGNFSKYRCPRCREPNCGRRCYKTHNEVRCLKFGL
jgi:zinc finger HIT domain-containing protein 1